MIKPLLEMLHKNHKKETPKGLGFESQEADSLLHFYVTKCNLGIQELQVKGQVYHDGCHCSL